MARWKHLNAQVLASTRIDSQGEQLSVESLRRLRDEFSSRGRMPLNQQHDLALDPVGYIENFDVVPAHDAPAHWVLVGDVSFHDVDIDEALRGFSYSMTERLMGPDDPHVAAFLPYPHYNDQSLMSVLLEGQPKAAVGAWRKKSADPATISLVIAFMLFLASPAYTNYWNATVSPFLARLRSRMSAGHSIEFCQTLRGPRGETYAAYFIPPRNESSEHITLALVSDALARLAEMVKADSLALERGIHLARLTFVATRYEVSCIQYLDGSVVHFPTSAAAAS